MSQARPTPEVLSLIAPASFSWLRVLLSLVVLLVFLLIALFSPKSAKPISVRKARSAVRSVLLVGPLASGKTALFSKLVYGHVAQSYTSMQENEGVVKVKRGGAAPASDEPEKPADSDIVLPRPLHLVDIPGHPRLRTRSLAQFLPAADGVVYTIDAASGLTGKNVRDAGEHLHVLFSLLSLLSNRRPATAMPRVLILLTKSDLLVSSKSPQLTLDRARQSLARELERRRVASSVGNRSAGAKLDGLDAIPIGQSGSRGGRSFLGRVLAGLGLAGSGGVTTNFATTGGNSGEGGAGGFEGLATDEGELLANEDTFLFEGAFEWDKMENALGSEIQWALASSTDDDSLQGLAQLWQWVEQDL